MIETEIVVIGGGIAGSSVAAALAARHRVVLVEREEHPGYHSTGRSAALFSEIYGNGAIRALSRASRAFLFDPPPGFSETQLVRPRGTLFLATESQSEKLNAYAALPDIAPATRLMNLEEMRALCPLLRSDYVAAGLYEPTSVDLGVHELQQGYLRLFKSRDGTLHCRAEVKSIGYRSGRWLLDTGDREIAATVVVNAAGAWADEIAAMAGLLPMHVTPYRRTAILVEPPAGTQIDDWPLLIDIDEQFYAKPDAGALLLSPADETPSPPCDAFAEEMDIAVAAYRVEQAIAMNIDRVKHSWAGLRSFSPDRAPIVGFDPGAEGFFWLAGQGGYGIQTAPAMAATACALLEGKGLPAELTDFGIDVAALSPDRFRTSPASAGRV
jgi:D-arginine dehydrogenase